MEAELFSTSFAHSNQLEGTEVKKSFLKLDRLELTEQTREEQRTDLQDSTDEQWEERDGWQVEHPSLRERNALMFNNEHMADVHFIVGAPGETKRVPAHKVVLIWAAAECRRQGLLVTPRNQRAVLGKALYLIRIPSMTLQEFADDVAQSDVLTLKETHDIFLWFTATSKPRLEFSAVKRSGLPPCRCHRFQSSAYRSNQWRYRGRCDSIQFAVDRRIFIAGLGLYGSSGGKAEYSVNLELKRQGTILAQNLTKFLSDGSSSIFPVWFENPVQVEPDTFYTVSVILDGSELSYFGQEGMTEVQCGKVTFQFQCSSDSTNGTGVQGGQIPELVFYC